MKHQLYRVTYKSHQIFFGNNIFTKEIYAINEKDARDKVSFEGQGLRTIIKIELA